MSSHRSGARRTAARASAPRTYAHAAGGAGSAATRFGAAYSLATVRRSREIGGGQEPWTSRLSRGVAGWFRTEPGSYASPFAERMRAVLNEPAAIGDSLVDEVVAEPGRPVPLAYHDRVWAVFNSFDTHNRAAGASRTFARDCLQLCGAILTHAEACSAGRKPARDVFALILYFLKLVTYRPYITPGEAQAQAAIDAMCALSDAIAAALDALVRAGSEAAPAGGAGAGAGAAGGAGEAAADAGEAAVLLPRCKVMMMDARSASRSIRHALRDDLTLLLDPHQHRLPVWKSHVLYGPMGSHRMVTQLSLLALSICNLSDAVGQARLDAFVGGTVQRLVSLGREEDSLDFEALVRDVSDGLHSFYAVLAERRAAEIAGAAAGAAGAGAGAAPPVVAAPFAISAAVPQDLLRLLRELVSAASFEGPDGPTARVQAFVDDACELLRAFDGRTATMEIVVEESCRQMLSFAGGPATAYLAGVAGAAMEGLAKDLGAFALTREDGGVVWQMPPLVHALVTRLGSVALHKAAEAGSLAVVTELLARLPPWMAVFVRLACATQLQSNPLPPLAGQLWRNAPIHSLLALQLSPHDWPTGFVSEVLHSRATSFMVALVGSCGSDAWLAGVRELGQALDFWTPRFAALLAAEAPAAGAFGVGFVGIAAAGGAGAGIALAGFDDASRARRYLQPLVVTMKGLLAGLTTRTATFTRANLGPAAFEQSAAAAFTAALALCLRCPAYAAAFEHASSSPGAGAGAGATAGDAAASAAQCLRAAIVRPLLEEPLQQLAARCSEFAFTGAALERLRAEEGIAAGEAARASGFAGLPALYQHATDVFAGGVWNLRAAAQSTVPRERLAGLLRWVDGAVVSQQANRYLPASLVPRRAGTAVALSLAVANRALAAVQEACRTAPFALPPRLSTFAALLESLTPGAGGRVPGLPDGAAGQQLLAAYAPAVAQLSHGFNELVERVLKPSVHRAAAVPAVRMRLRELHSLRDNFESTLEAWRECLPAQRDAIAAVTLPRIAEDVQHVEQLQDRARDLLAVEMWLRSKDLVREEQVPMPALEDCTAEELQQLMTQSERAVGLTVPRATPSAGASRSAAAAPRLQEGAKEALSDLCFFVRAGSQLFDSFFSEELQAGGFTGLASIRIGGGVDPVVAIIIAATKAATAALRNLVQDENMTLSAIESGDGMGNVLRNLRGRRGASLLSEINIVVDYLRQQASGSVDGGAAAGGAGAGAGAGSASSMGATPLRLSDIQVKQERLANAVKLLRIKTLLPDALATMKQRRLVSPEDDGYRNLASVSLSLADTGAIRLRQVGEILSSLSEQLAGLEPHHLELLGCLQKAQELVTFLQAEPDFQAQMALITQEMQGNLIYQSVLDNLSVSARFLGRLIPGLGRGAAAAAAAGAGRKLSEVTSVLRAACATERETQHVISSIQSTVEHMSEITLWFSGGGALASTDKTVSNVQRYLANGVFVAYARGHMDGEGLQLWPEGRPELKLTSERLIEQVRAAVFVKDENIADTKKAALKTFIRAYELACECHAALLRAEDLGLPQYQSVRLELPRPISEEGLSERVELIADECRRWEAALRQAVEAQPRLSLLDGRQRLQLLAAIQLRDRHAVVSQLLTCFPDAQSRGDGAAAAAGSAAVQAGLARVFALINDATAPHFSAAATAPAADGAAGGTAALNAAVAMLRAADAALVTAEAVQSHENNMAALDASPAKLLRVSSPAGPVLSTGVYRALCNAMQGELWPCQLLWCSDRTTEGQLESFTSRMRRMPFLSYAIVGVDVLRVTVREALLRSLINPDAPLETSALYLVFTSGNGIEAFSFLEQDSADEVPEHTVRTFLAQKAALPLFAPVTIVAGRALDGKTRLIRQRIEALTGEAASQRSFTATMHESFTPQNMMRWYRGLLANEGGGGAEGAPAPVAVHVNILPRTRERAGQIAGSESEVVLDGRHLQRLSRFLHHMTCQGILVDEETGEVVALQRNRAHHIFVELPALENWPAGQAARGVGAAADAEPARHPYLQYVPSLLHMQQAWAVASTTAFPFIIDDNARLVARYLELRASNALDATNPLPPSVASATLPDARATDLLAGLWANATCAAIPAINGQRALLVRLLGDRCRYLARLMDHLRAKAREDESSRTLLSLGNCAQQVFGLLLREAVALVDGSLHGDWAAVPVPFIVRNEDVIQPLEVLQMAHMDMRTAVAQSGNLECVLSGDVARENPGRLRAAIAPAFGVLETNKFLNMAKSMNYVITPDFALKLLVINEYRRIGASMVLSGETGTGKTEILSLYSLLVNNDAAHVPDMLAELCAVLQQLVLSGAISPEKNEHRGLFRYNSDGSVVIRVVEGKRVGTLKPPLELVDSLYALPEEEDADVVRAFALPLLDHFSSVFESKQLMHMPDSVAAAVSRHKRWKHLLDMAKRVSLLPADVTGAAFDVDGQRRMGAGDAAATGAGASGAGSAAVAPPPPFHPLSIASDIAPGYTSRNGDAFLTFTARGAVAETLPPGLESGDADDQPAGTVVVAASAGSAGTAPTGEQQKKLRPGINTCADLALFIRGVLTSKPHEAFWRIRMHEGVTASHWRQKVLAVNAAARSLREKTAATGRPFVVICFVDELNTTSLMGMVKEVFVDRMLDGQPLESNIFWVGAVNPFGTTLDSRRVASGSAAAGAGAGAGGGAGAAPPPPPTLARTHSSDGAHATGNFTGTVDDGEEERYIVRAMPVSLQQMVLEVAALTPPQEKAFVHSFLADSMVAAMPPALQECELRDALITAFKEAVLASQSFVRSARMHRVEVSIRDMVRAAVLFRFYASPANRVIFLGPPAADDDSASASSGEEGAGSAEAFGRRSDDILKELDWTWKALNMALCMVYYWRLDTKHKDPDSGRVRNLREQYRRTLSDVFTRHGPAMCRGASFESIVSGSLRHLFEGTRVPTGIAPTVPLMETVYASVSCIEASLALIITGPPGCGKTLGATLAMDNMKGASSNKQAYQRLRFCQKYTYQCSEASTASEIKQVYLSAEARYRRFQQSGINTERVVVFLDEASLPPQRRAALKVTHYFLDRADGSDRPNCATLMLTNRTLDAAKSNRAVTVRQNEATAEDLKLLAMGCLTDDSASTEDSHATLQRQVEGLCRAFSHANDYADRDIFHNRDFIYMLRFLRRAMTLRNQGAGAGAGAGRLMEAAGATALDAELVLAALRRNFNGLPPAKFAALADRFLYECGLKPGAAPATVSHPALVRAVSEHHASKRGIAEEVVNDPALQPRVIATLREALADRLAPGEEPNHSAFRHIMLLDRTGTECGLSLLFDLNIIDRSRSEVVTVSDFPADDTDLARAELAARVKCAIEEGRTVVLVNAQPLYSALFDCLNQHYSSIGGNEGEAAAAAEDDAAAGGASGGAAAAAPAAARAGRKQYYANIGIGAYSRPCLVHPDARIIVHMPASQLATTQLPFLNRFEKYQVTVEDVLREQLQLALRNELGTAASSLHSTATQAAALGDGSTLASVLHMVMGGCEHFINFMGRKSFYGMLQGETSAALVLRALRDTQTNSSRVPLIRRPFHVRTVIAAPSARPQPAGAGGAAGSSSDASSGGHASGSAAHASSSGVFSLTALDGEASRLAIAADDDFSATADGDGGEFEGDGSAQGLELGSSSTSVAGRLREFIRAINFQLLQYARPECVFLRRKELPASYLREYVQRQEHFCGANLVRSLITAHFDTPLGTATLNPRDPRGDKWMLYCRTSADLLQLGSLKSSHLQLLPHMPDVRPELAKKMITVHQLGLVSSTEELEALAQGFFRRPAAAAGAAAGAGAGAADAADARASPSAARHRQVLLLVADRAVVTLSQVNVALRIVDTASAALEPSERPLVIMVQHVPQERLQFGAAFDTVPLAWDFAYCDSFGLQIAADEDAAGAGTSAGAEPEARTPYDPRRWMQVAFGLSKKPSKEAAMSEFRGELLNEIRLAGAAMQRPGIDTTTTLTRRGVSLAVQIIYTQQRARGEALERFFSERSYLLEEVLSSFADTWAAALDQSVEGAATALLQGSSVESLLDGTRSTLRGLVRAFARNLVALSCSDYGLHALASLPTSEAIRQRGVQPPKLPNIAFALNVLQAEPPLAAERQRQLSEALSVGIRLSWARAPSLPLFSVLLSQLQRLRAQILSQLPADSPLETVVERADRVIGATCAPLRDALQALDSEPDGLLRRSFVGDFIQCALGFADASEDELRVLRWALDVRTHGEEPSIVRLVCSEIARPVLGDLMSLMAPLRHLQKAPTAAAAVGGAGAAGAGTADPHSLPIFRELLRAHLGGLGHDGGMGAGSGAAVAAAAAGGDIDLEDPVAHLRPGRFDSAEALRRRLELVVVNMLWQELLELAASGKNVPRTKLGPWLRAVRDMATRYSNKSEAFAAVGPAAVLPLALMLATRSVMLHSPKAAAGPILSALGPHLTTAGSQLKRAIAGEDGPGLAGMFAVATAAAELAPSLAAGSAGSKLASVLDAIAAVALPAAAGAGARPPWLSSVVEEAIAFFTGSIGACLVPAAAVRDVSAAAGSATGASSAVAADESDLQVIAAAILDPASAGQAHGPVLGCLSLRVRLALLMDLAGFAELHGPTAETTGTHRAAGALGVSSASMRRMLSEALAAVSPAAVPASAGSSSLAALPYPVIAAHREALRVLAANGIDVKADAALGGASAAAFLAPEAGKQPSTLTPRDMIRTALLERLSLGLGAAAGGLASLAEAYTVARRSAATHGSHDAALASVEAEALACALLKTAAEALSGDRGALASIMLVGETLAGIFREQPAYRSYFLACFRSEAAAQWLVSDRDRLRALDLGEVWYLPAEAPSDGAAQQAGSALERAYVCMPCVVDPTAPLGAEYARIAALIRGPPEVTQAQLAAWVAAMPAGQTAATWKYSARMLLLLATYHEAFEKGEARPAVAAYTGSADGRRTLDLTAVEATVFAKIAAGPDRNPALVGEDGMAYLFSAVAVAPPAAAGGAGAAPNAAQRSDIWWNIVRRTAALNVMACIMGMPRQRSYYAMCAFATERLSSTIGLGSGYVTISKDCGYQTQVLSTGVDFKDFGYVLGEPPFRGLRRHRALNNYMKWCALSWGMWLHGDGSPAMEGLTYTTTTDSNELFFGELRDRAGNVIRRALTPRQQLSGAILTRANNFLAMLETDSALAERGVSPAMYLSVVALNTALQSQRSDVARDHFPTSNRDDLGPLRRTQEFLMDSCWEPVFTEAPARWRRLYQAAARATFKVEAVCTARQAMVRAQAANAFVAPDSVTAIISAAADAATGPAAPAVKQAAALTRVVLDRLGELEMGEHLGLLVYFYSWIHEKLAYRLTVQEAMETRLVDAIRRLPSREDVEEGERLLRRFLRVWNQMQATFMFYNECAAAQAAGETPIPVLNEQELTVYAMTTQPHADTIDHISRMLNSRLVLQQNKLLGEASLQRLLEATSRPVGTDGRAASLEADDAADGAAVGVFNPFTALAEPLPAEFDLRFMPRLVGGSTAPVDVCLRQPEELHAWLCTHAVPAAAAAGPAAGGAGAGAAPSAAAASSAALDVEAAARFIIRRYISARPMLRATALRAPFLYRIDWSSQTPAYAPGVFTSGSGAGAGAGSSASAASMARPGSAVAAGSAVAPSIATRAAALVTMLQKATGDTASASGAGASGSCAGGAVPAAAAAPPAVPGRSFTSARVVQEMLRRCRTEAAVRTVLEELCSACELAVLQLGQQATQAAADGDGTADSHVDSPAAAGAGAGAAGDAIARAASASGRLTVGSVWHAVRASADSSSAASGVLRNLRALLQGEPLASLATAADLARSYFESKDFLFSNLPAEHMAPLPAPVKEALDAHAGPICTGSAEALARRQDNLQALAAVLLDPAVQGAFAAVPPETSFVAVRAFSDRVTIASFDDTLAELLDAVLRSLQVKHLGAVLRQVHGMCGQLADALSRQQLREAAEAAAAQRAGGGAGGAGAAGTDHSGLSRSGSDGTGLVYAEQVPAQLRQLQLELPQSLTVDGAASAATAAAAVAAVAALSSPSSAAAASAASSLATPTASAAAAAAAAVVVVGAASPTATASGSAPAATALPPAAPPALPARTGGVAGAGEPRIGFAPVYARGAEGQADAPAPGAALTALRATLGLGEGHKFLQLPRFAKDARMEVADVQFLVRRDLLPCKVVGAGTERAVTMISSKYLEAAAFCNNALVPLSAAAVALGARDEAAAMAELTSLAAGVRVVYVGVVPEGEATATAGMGSAAATAAASAKVAGAGAGASTAPSAPGPVAHAVRVQLDDYLQRREAAGDASGSGAGAGARVGAAATAAAAPLAARPAAAPAPPSSFRPSALPPSSTGSASARSGAGSAAPAVGGAGAAAVGGAGAAVAAAVAAPVTAPKPATSPALPAPPAPAGAAQANALVSLPFFAELAGMSEDDIGGLVAAKVLGPRGVVRAADGTVSFAADAVPDLLGRLDNESFLQKLTVLQETLVDFALPDIVAKAGSLKMRLYARDGQVWATNDDLSRLLGELLT